MISTKDVCLSFGSRKLFENVTLKFSNGNCYGIIGANGAGKSTLLKILSKEIEPSSGEVFWGNDESISVLKQDHFHYENESVLQTVILGNERLHQISQEKDAIYMKPNFSDEDGVKAAELESEFARLGGWEAESNAATLLKGLGIVEEAHEKKLKELKDSDKIKVLLAQALFGKPDNLLLDEPTNHLDTASIRWLEDYLLEQETNVIVVSHDRHFLNRVCTHMVDIDFKKVNLYVGNYDFWRKSSMLIQRLRNNENKRKEDKAKELMSFIQRFSANASKSKQATSRRKQLEKLTIEEMPSSSRRYPHIAFKPFREAGDILLEVDNLSKTVGGEKVLDNISFRINANDKVLFSGQNDIAISALLNILSGIDQADSGTINWGVTTKRAFLPKDHNDYFNEKQVNLIDWLRQFSEDQSENYVRGFLGRMLFSGEETLKSVKVLSGGEKVRCMLSRMMLLNANVLIFDGPTYHLDLESISALNDGLIDFQGTILFSTHDQEFAQTLSNRVIEIKDGKIFDHQIPLEKLQDKSDFSSNHAAL